MAARSIRIEDVSVHYGPVAALDRVSLTVQEGEFLALLGPSGCGKTTLLRVVGGLAAVSAGAVYIGDQPCTHLPPYRRSIGVVFQDYALFPHMTVYDNVAFGLRMHRVPAAEIKPRVTGALGMLGLKALARRYPRQLSGGQQQRVALARAIVISPDVLLLDEPLSALDRKLREEMQVEIRLLQQRLGITTIFVTHDQEEALTMADRIAVMAGGRILQMGSPGEIYERPRDQFVSSFIGKCNLFPARVAGRHQDTLTCRLAGDAEIQVPAPDQGAGPGDAVHVGVRPERMTLVDPGEPAGAANRLPGVLEHVTYLGMFTQYHVACAGDQRVLVVEQNRAGPARDKQFAPGSQVAVTWAPADGLLLQAGDQTEE